MTIPRSLYEADTAAWALANAAALRERRFDELDIEHLIEELDDMGKSERRALESHLSILLMHLLKWQHQANLRSRSWEQSIANARADIEDSLVDSPSLRPRLDDSATLTRCYARARRTASVETGLDIELFPALLPYTNFQIQSDWLPR